MKINDLYKRLESSLSTYTILDVDEEWPFGWDLTRDHQVAKPAKQTERDGASQNVGSGNEKRKSAEASGVETSRVEASHVKSSHTEASGVEASGVEASGVEASGVETSHVKSSHAEASHRGRNKKSYSAQKDKRLKDLFEVSTDVSRIRQMLNTISTIIVSGLCKYSLRAPSGKELDTLLSVAGVTATEMNIFAGRLSEASLTCYGGVNVRPLAILFSRVLFDALCEDCGIAGWTTEEAGVQKGAQTGAQAEPGSQGKKKSKSKAYAYVNSRECRDKLQRFVAHLRELGLLELDCLHGAYPWEKEHEGLEQDTQERDTQEQDTQEQNPQGQNLQEQNLQQPVEADKIQHAIEVYNEFFYRHTLLNCMRMIAYREMEETTKQIEKEAKRISAQTEKLMMQQMREAAHERSTPQRKFPNSAKSSKSPKSTVIPFGAPFNPAGPFGVGPDASFNKGTPYPFLGSPDGVLEQARILAAEGKEDAANQLLERDFESRQHAPGVDTLRKRSQRAYQALDDYSNAIRDNCIEVINQTAKMQGEYLASDVGVDIAECALIALMNGDECYKLSVASYVFPQLGRLLGVPGTEFELLELSDEDEWNDFIYPGDNGKLAQAIVKEDEVAVYGTEDLGPFLLRTVRPGGAIADYSGCQFNDGLYIRKSHVAAFREMGYSERRARDFAIIIATLRYTLERDDLAGGRVFSESGSESDEESRGTGRDKPEDTTKIVAVDEAQAPTADDLRLLTMERDEAIRRHKAADRECQKLRHDVAEGYRTLEALEEEVKRLKERLDRQDELIDAYTRIEEERDKGQEEITFPFITDRNVILYGGFRVFHAELEKLIPGIRIVESASHIDTTAFRNADIIFLQINKTNHSNYWNVCDTAKNAGVPYYHLNFANARRCAEEMVKRIRGLK